MTWSLRTRLTLSYVLVALLCVLMVSVLANGVLESSFRRYVRDSQSRQVQQVVTQVGAQHAAGGIQFVHRQARAPERGFAEQDHFR